MTKGKMKRSWLKEEINYILDIHVLFSCFCYMKKHGNKDKEQRENGRENQTFNPFKKLTHPQTNYKKHCSNTHAPSLYMTTIVLGLGVGCFSEKPE